MTSDLGFWMAIFVFAALAYFETPLGRMIRAGARMLWGQVAPETLPSPRRRRPTPIRLANGRLAGSFPARNEEEPRSAERSAQESGGTNVTAVPTGTIPIPDMLVIAARIGSGMAPNEVAKSLPGYSGRKYAEYVERVRHVRAVLDEHGALDMADKPS